MITVQNVIDTFDRMEVDPEWIDLCRYDKIATTIYDRSKVTRPSAEVTIDVETEYEDYGGVIEFYAPQDDF